MKRSTLSSRKPLRGGAARSDRGLCSQVCGAQCCRGSVIQLTEEEAERLPRLAASLGAPPPDIRPDDSGEARLYAAPCVFLSGSNLCRIYAQRPGRCQAFPSTLLEWCLLSKKRFEAASD